MILSLNGWRRKAIAALIVLPITVLVVSLFVPGSRSAYVARQAAFQIEMLRGRVPISEALASGDFTPRQRKNLKLVSEIKAYGERVGLSATENYDTINPTWTHRIWNVSACNALAFKPRKWWFPVVGSVPYLGFFEEPRARAQAAQLEAEGYDVHVRTAGAYSTLGWFRDPLLPHMLKWNEQSLANTLLHELAHATLWVRGSVQFNESFAKFVGDVAAKGYLIDKYGADSKLMRRAGQREEDNRRYRALLRELYRELDDVYKDPALSKATKSARKQALFADLPVRVDALALHDQARFSTAVRKGRWNNARMMGYRRYNRSHEWFAALLDQQDGDLLGFIRRIDTITRGADDPYVALAKAIGADPKSRTKDPAAK